MHISYLPSYKKMKIMLLMFNYKIICFDDQKVYKNKRCFFTAMKSLKRQGLVVRNRNDFKLTDKGQKIAVMLNEFD